MARKLHPAMAAHSRKVAIAHATLAKQPAFKALAPRERLAAVQAHIRKGRSR